MTPERLDEIQQNHVSVQAIDLPMGTVPFDLKDTGPFCKTCVEGSNWCGEAVATSWPCDAATLVGVIATTMPAYRTALEFYAAESSYWTESENPCDSSVCGDGGMIAQEALRGSSE